MFVYAWDDWEFDPTSGELRRRGDTPIRIQPQPAQLLELLLDRAGEVVTRDDIIQAIWSDTKVEFDQAVNYSIRHLRAALSESAAESRYIETLPRRGYRFVGDVSRIGSAERADPKPPFVPRIAFAGIVVGALGLALAMWALSDRERDGLRSTEPTLPPVVGVMVLRHAEEDPLAQEAAASMADRLTALMTQAAGDGARILGPTTTDRFRASSDMLARLRSEVGVDYLLGGRISPAQPDGLFLEFIRMSDGAHLVALTGEPDGADVLPTLVDSLATILEWN